MRGQYQVSRQHYYYQRQLAVELAVGGIDATGCDMLHTEDKEWKKLEGGYDDPVEAAEAAIKLHGLWSAVSSEPVGIAYGYNLDQIEGEVSEQDYEEVYEKLREWAREEKEGLAKCEWCGDIIVEEYTVYDYEDVVFCSERCAERYAEEWSVLEEDETE